MLASQDGYLGVVQALLAAGANVNATNTTERRTTALIQASQEGQVNVVSALLEAGADVNYAGPDEATALVMAIQNQHIATLKRLVLAGANVDTIDSGFSMLMIAVLRGNLEIVRCLCDNGADIFDAIVDGDKSIDALLLASLRGNVDIVEFLVSRGVTGEQSLAKALSFATHPDIIAVLQSLV